MTVTLDDARLTWFNHTIINDGGYCPCCDRWGKTYRRGINRTMAGSMVWLAEHAPPGSDWVKPSKVGPRFMIGSNQFTTMKWWGACERCPADEDEDVKHSGLWRMTELGMDWVANRVTLPKFVWTYNDEVKRFDEPMVRISDIIEDFSYGEIMSARFAASTRRTPRRGRDRDPDPDPVRPTA
jgi:hypothetical protein